MAQEAKGDRNELAVYLIDEAIRRGDEAMARRDTYEPADREYVAAVLMTQDVLRDIRLRLVAPESKAATATLLTFPRRTPLAGTA